jgi:hypothetical protein
MTLVGADADYDTLSYLEFTRTRAAAFLEKEDVS